MPLGVLCPHDLGQAGRRQRSSVRWRGPHHGHSGNTYSLGVYIDAGDAAYPVQQTVYYADSSADTATSVTPNPAPIANITVVNPKSNGVTLTYSLDGQEYLIAPGYSQQIHQACVVEFDRGGDAGAARYSMTDICTFTPVNGTWELYQSDNP